jgi:hypothetical protein
VRWREALHAHLGNPNDLEDGSFEAMKAVAASEEGDDEPASLGLG